MVEETGFEPTTSWSRTKRATKLRYSSKYTVLRPLGPEPRRRKGALHAFLAKSSVCAERLLFPIKILRLFMGSLKRPNCAVLAAPRSLDRGRRVSSADTIIANVRGICKQFFPAFRKKGGIFAKERRTVAMRPSKGLAEEQKLMKVMRSAKGDSPLLRSRPAEFEAGGPQTAEGRLREIQRGGKNFRENSRRVSCHFCAIVI